MTIPAQIRLLYLRELRSSLRERAIVVNGILMPLFLYPLILWSLFTGLTFVEGLNEGFTSRVVFAGAVPPAHQSMVDSVAADSDFEVRFEEDVEDPVERLREGSIDAVVTFRASPAEGLPALPGDAAVTVFHDRSETRSERARSRIEAHLDRHRERWTDGLAEEAGIDAAARTGWAIASTNVSPEEEQGALILGAMLSIFMVVMVALGCFIPAVDTTAGERERSTWETLMTVSASRSSIVIAKYLHVATLGIVAGLLNVLAMFLSVGSVIRPLLGAEESFRFELPPLALPVMALGAVVLALFFAAGMMVLASFARTFKDGQAMVQPVYYLTFLPLLLGNQTDLTLTPGVAAIPVANVAMMVRDALNGVFLWPLILQTLAVNLGAAALFLLAARRVLAFEDFLLGSFDGSFWSFARTRLLPGRTRGTPAPISRKETV